LKESHKFTRLLLEKADMRVYRLYQIALALYFCREYAAAAEAANQGIRSYPDRPGSYRVLAAALGQLGRTAEAEEALEKAIAIAPEHVDSDIRGRLPGVRPEDHAHIIEGLRKAGWRDE
jgi:tetratricopeptide (TPR) repeat protein